MAIDENTVKRVANLARLNITDQEVTKFHGEINGVLGMIDKLQDVNVDGLEPLTSVIPANAPLRDDVVTDGEKQADILANAPLAREGFFAVPKVVE